MKAIHCKVIAYTYSGCVIDEIECDSLKEAREEAKELKGMLSCYTCAIYNKETGGLIE